MVLTLGLMGCAMFSSDAPGEVVQSSSSAPIQHVWSVDVDQRLPAKPTGFSQAAVTSSGLIVIGSQTARVHVYNSKGTELKRIAIKEACDSAALALKNGLVVLSDVGGMLYAIDPEIGHIAWQYQLSSSLTGTPVMVGNNFILQTADNRVYRFSDAGKKLWSYAGSSTNISLYLNASPLVTDDTIYAVLSNGDAVALRLDNGDLSWRRQLLLDSDAAVLSELRVAIANPIILNHAAMGMQKSDDILLVSFYQGDMLFLSKKDGSQQFSFPLSIKSTPALVGDVLYLSDAKGSVHAVDQKTGQTLWQKKISDGELVGPVVWGGKLWLADDLGHVIRLEMNGSGLVSQEVNGSIDRAPLVTTSGVLIRTGLGALHLFH
ncbi:MAG: PQQ-binding-like beta-propeller repeat protein [Mariprofundaceae bacterium]